MSKNIAANPPAPTDVLRECASLLLGVSYQDVTDVQREYVKCRAYPYTYGNHTGAWPHWLRPLQQSLRHF